MRPTTIPTLFAANPHVSIAGAAPITWASFVEANAGELDADKLDEIFADLSATGAYTLAVGDAPEIVILAVVRPVVASFRAAGVTLDRLPVPGRREFVGKRIVRRAA